MTTLLIGLVIPVMVCALMFAVFMATIGRAL